MTATLSIVLFAGQFLVMVLALLIISCKVNHIFVNYETSVFDSTTLLARFIFIL